MLPVFASAGSTWLMMLIAAIVNGTFREKYLKLHFSPLVSHIISTFSLCALILLITYFFILHFGRCYEFKTLVLIGTFWLTLTLCFEFAFGHFIAGHSWQSLLAEYNLLKGRIWILVLITTFFAPVICHNLINK